MGKTSISYTKYLGGLPGEKGQSIGGNLQITEECIGMGTMNPKKHVVRWDQTAGISFNADTFAKSRAGKVVMFGPLGLLARNTQQGANILVQLRDGNTAIYECERESAIRVRAKFQPFMTAHDVPCLDDSPSPVAAAAPVPAEPAPSTADELLKLAQLRESGVLSEEEFQAQKAKLLQ